MKRNILLLIACCLGLAAAAQKKERYYSASLFTVQNAMPLGKFAGLFGEIVHPGMELGYGKIIRTREKHDLLLEYKLGYFYHRFVQHAIPVTANLAYRYRFTPRFGALASLGAGYLHSVPATAKLKLDASGEYKNDKGIGRMQATATVSIGIQYSVNPAATRPIRLFALYQQRLQFPYVRSYVPLLPYNGFQFGFSRSLLPKNQKH